MAAMQGHPLRLAAAAIYVHLVVEELTKPSPGRTNRLRRILRLRRHNDYRRLRFPATIMAALDDLEDLYSVGGKPITAAAYARYSIRRKRARHAERLREAMSLRLSVAGAIRDLAVRSTATRRCLEKARGLIRQTLRLLPVDPVMSEYHNNGGGGGGGGGEATTERVVSVVEFLARFQGMEADLVADTEAMGAEHECLLRRLNAAEDAELAEMAALEVIPELPPATEEEAQLIRDTARRALHDLVVLTKFHSAAVNYLRV
uniref:Uncharacterized protein n=1 Tax=Oryza punctata TaxID=4537 RepID=A0A0E0MMA0_ORYPU